MEAVAVMDQRVGNVTVFVERPVCTGPRFVSSMIRTPKSGRLGAQPLQLSPTHPGKPRDVGGEQACRLQMVIALQTSTGNTFFGMLVRIVLWVTWPLVSRRRVLEVLTGLP